VDVTKGEFYCEESAAGHEEEQIIGVIREAEGDTPVKAACRATQRERGHVFQVAEQMWRD